MLLYLLRRETERRGREVGGFMRKAWLNLNRFDRISRLGVLNDPIFQGLSAHYVFTSEEVGCKTHCRNLRGSRCFLIRWV